MNNDDEDFYNWISRLGDLPFTSGNNSNSSTTLSSFENDLLNEGSVRANLLELHRKYLGSDLYAFEDSQKIFNDYNFAINILEGYNHFYLLSGEFYSQLPDSNFEIPLAQAGFVQSQATAGSSIDLADIIWQRQGAELSGAWLKSFENELKNETVHSSFVPGHNIFRFPFPGKGLSAQELGWTGPLASNIGQRLLPVENIDQLKSEIADIYWNFKPSLSSCVPLDIHQTTLIDDGARSSPSIKLADQIHSRKSLHDMENHRTDFLYSFDNIQLPISPGTNKIYFPVERIDTSDETTVTIPDFQMNIDQCSPFLLSEFVPSQSMIGAVASLDINSADKIIKNAGYCGATTEVAWLSGCPITQTGPLQYSSTQPSLFSVFQPGIETRFIYSLENMGNVDVNTILHGLDHEPWCPYLSLQHTDYLTNTERVNPLLDYDQALKCMCKSVYYSPMGHGRSFQDYWNFCDVVYLDPLSGFGTVIPFSPTIWRDREGNPWGGSNQCARFIYNGIEPNVGWGRGGWETGNGEPFILKQGEVYVYRRSDINSCGTTPPLILNRVNDRANCIKSPRMPVWAKGSFQNDEYVSADIASDMVLMPTDIITYIHQPKYDFLVSAISAYTFSATIVSTTSAMETITVDGDTLNNIVFTETEMIVLSSGTEILQNTISHMAPSFVWSTPLVSSRPFWAMADEKYCLSNETYLKIVDDYLPITQPSASDLKLSYDLYFDYYRAGREPFIWNQPVTFYINELRNPEWMNIESISYSSSNTIDAITNSFQEIEFIKFSASTVPSSLILETKYSCNFLSEIIYCAKNPFTWSVNLTSDNYCQYVPPTLELYAQASYPWRNVQNNTKGYFKSNYLQLNDNVDLGETEIISKKKKSKTKIGILTPDRTAKEVLRGKDLTIDYICPENCS